MTFTHSLPTRSPARMCTVHLEGSVQISFLDILCSVLYAKTGAFYISVLDGLSLWLLTACYMVGWGSSILISHNTTDRVNLLNCQTVRRGVMDIFFYSQMRQLYRMCGGLLKRAEISACNQWEIWMVIAVRSQWVKNKGRVFIAQCRI